MTPEQETGLAIYAFCACIPLVCWALTKAKVI